MSPLLTQRRLGPLKRLAHDLAFSVFYRFQRDDLVALHERTRPSGRAAGRGGAAGLAPDAPRSARLQPGSLSATAGLVERVSRSASSAVAGAARPARRKVASRRTRRLAAGRAAAGLLRLWQHAGPRRAGDAGNDPAGSSELGSARGRRRGLERADDARDERTQVVDAVNHQSLLPRCPAAVHHGGAGRPPAGAGAGIPALVSRCLADQPFRGARCRALGIGDTIPFKSSTAGAFTMLRRYSTRRRARPGQGGRSTDG